MKLTKLLFSLLAVNQCEASTGAVKKTATDADAIKDAGEVVWNVLAAVNPLVTVRDERTRVFAFVLYVFALYVFACSHVYVFVFFHPW